MIESHNHFRVIIIFISLSPDYRLPPDYVNMYFSHCFLFSLINIVLPYLDYIFRSVLNQALIPSNFLNLKNNRVLFFCFLFLIYVRKMDIFRWIFRIQFFEKCLEQISLANLFIYFSAHY